MARRRFFTRILYYRYDYYHDYSTIIIRTVSKLIRWYKIFIFSVPSPGPIRFVQSARVSVAAECCAASVAAAAVRGYTDVRVINARGRVDNALITDDTYGRDRVSDIILIRRVFLGRAKRN